MNIGEVGVFVAVGFVPTLIALEMVYRMGRAIGRRGEAPLLGQNHNKLRKLFAKICKINVPRVNGPHIPS